LTYLEAVTRQRRVILNYDAVAGLMPWLDGEELVTSMFGSADLPNSPIDSVFWNWGEGNYSLYKSKHTPSYNFGRFAKWVDEGWDIIGLCHEGAKARGLESFFSYRINGNDADPVSPGKHIAQIPPFKQEHPEWLIHGGTFNRKSPPYNFAIKEVREHKLDIIAEALDRYDFDGVEIDFARVCPVLPPGQQWELRWAITEFMAGVRDICNEEARHHKKPVLVAARVPETLEGCHFDGLDVEQWIESLSVDILTLGCRSFEVDYRAFHDLTAHANNPVRCYPCIDDIHATDGYRNPPMEVFRGVFANWRRQGFTGVQTFNFQNSNPMVERIDPEYLKNHPMVGKLTISEWLQSQWDLHCRVYQELQVGDTFLDDDKVTFVIQRRGGGHSPHLNSFPWDWNTPRWLYCNTNMEGQLPALLYANPLRDVILKMYVSKIGMAEIRVELSRPEEIEVRVNNILAHPVDVKRKKSHRWMIPKARLALGENLIGISLRKKKWYSRTTIEKVEIEVL